MWYSSASHIRRSLFALDDILHWGNTQVFHTTIYTTFSKISLFNFNSRAVCFEEYGFHVGLVKHNENNADFLTRVHKTPTIVAPS